MDDLGAAEAHDFGQDLVGVLAQDRGCARRLARERTKLDRQAGHQVAADVGLVQELENRMLGREVGILGHGLRERAELGPGDPGTIEVRGELLDPARGKPRGEQRRQLLARLEPVAL